jgi:hypothetical protein
MISLMYLSLNTPAVILLTVAGMVETCDFDGRKGQQTAKTKGSRIVVVQSCEFDERKTIAVVVQTCEFDEGKTIAVVVQSCEFEERRRQQRAKRKVSERDFVDSCGDRSSLSRTLLNEGGELGCKAVYSGQCFATL